MENATYAETESSHGANQTIPNVGLPVYLAYITGDIQLLLMLLVAWTIVKTVRSLGHSLWTSVVCAVCFYILIVNKLLPAPLQVLQSALTIVMNATGGTEFWRPAVFFGKQMFQLLWSTISKIALDPVGLLILRVIPVLLGNLFCPRRQVPSTVTD